MNTPSTSGMYLNLLLKVFFIAAATAMLSLAIGVISAKAATASDQQPSTKTTPPLTSVKVAKFQPGAPITEAEVNAAQQAWCDALVNIGKVYAAVGDYKTVANQAITDLYDYDHGKVFFKPTLAHGANTFRPTKAGALSYFVGGNPAYPEDAGFALKRWVEVSYDNNAAENGIQIHGDIAITMGNVYLTDADGNRVTVDKTFVFRRCSDGKLRLVVHKSSLPFDPAK
ncbi:MAG TPA: hypothetical protein VMJ32_09695 [Pirellulales bacterium]|nr:hypothetical protein [Pirellulales bacterium]